MLPDSPRAVPLGGPVARAHDQMLPIGGAQGSEGPAGRNRKGIPQGRDSSPSSNSILLLVDRVCVASVRLVSGTDDVAAAEFGRQGAGRGREPDSERCRRREFRGLDWKQSQRSGAAGTLKRAGVFWQLRRGVAGFVRNTSPNIGHLLRLVGKR